MKLRKGMCGNLPEFRGGRGGLWKVGWLDSGGSCGHGRASPARRGVGVRVGCEGHFPDRGPGLPPGVTPWFLTATDRYVQVVRRDGGGLLMIWLSGHPPCRSAEGHGRHSPNEGIRTGKREPEHVVGG